MINTKKKRKKIKMTKRKISGYYGYWCTVKKKRIFKTLYEKIR